MLGWCRLPLKFIHLSMWKIWSYSLCCCKMVYRHALELISNISVWPWHCFSTKVRQLLWLSELLITFPPPLSFCWPSCGTLFFLSLLLWLPCDSPTSGYPALFQSNISLLSNIVCPRLSSFHHCHLLEQLPLWRLPLISFLRIHTQL